MPFFNSAILVSNAVSMAPHPPTPKANAALPGNSAPATVNTILKPQLYMNGSQMAYPPFAGAFAYGQWATGTTPYGVGAQHPSHPYTYFGAAANVPQRQSFSQLSFAQIYGQSQVPPRDNQEDIRSSCLTVVKNDTAPLHSTPEHKTSETLQLSGLSVQSNHLATAEPIQVGVPTQLNADSPPAGAQSRPQEQDVSALQTAQLAEILRANPQLASMVLAAIGQAQPHP